MPDYFVTSEEITELVRSLALKANMLLPKDMISSLEEAERNESSTLGRQALQDIISNAKLAEKEWMPICQDCGLAVVFVEVGQELRVIGGDFEEAINEGIRRAYEEGYLRKSVVKDPLFDRVNSSDNTPAIIHWQIVPGKDIKITVAPKGMGSENMSRIYMLKPADGAEGVIQSVIETVRAAGPNPCPPIVVGIGLGGNFETAALAAKKALLLPNGSRNPNGDYANLEEEILAKINELDIGPGGYGGVTTALDVHIIALPTHIAGMPLAINICCHALRHSEGIIEGRVKND